LYSKAKIWVSIPESDATSISLLEAMACGCIPIVSDLPANREWIKSGVNGIVVKDLESDFISEALIINEINAIELNKKRIMLDGSKESNREKFINLYNIYRFKIRW
jgi:glycosyltransferase involved in cell wall biosynthesis